MAGIWSRLQVTETPSGLLVAFVDSLGATFSDTTPGRGIGALDLSGAILERLDLLVHRAADKRDPTLPLYVAPPRARRGHDWEAHVDRIIRDGLGDIPLAVLRDARTPLVRRHLPSPLTVAIDDRVPNAREVRNRVANESDAEESASPRGAFTRPPTELNRSDVVVVRATDLAKLLANQRRLAPHDRPLLTIAVGPEANRLTREHTPPAGSALMGTEARPAPLAVAQAIATLTSGDSLARVARDQSALLTTTPHFVEALEAARPRATAPIRRRADVPRRGRRVDLAVFEQRGVERIPVERGSGLVASAYYELDVSIGVPFPSSLLDASPTPIDKLLPQSSKGWMLDIALFSNDLKITGPRTRRVRLPPSGPARTLHFAFRAPRVRARRTISGRVVVFHKNYAVQAFRISATVSPRGAELGDLRATIEVTSRPEIDNLADVRRRHLFIGTNLDADRRSHTIIAKGRTGVGTIALNNQQAQKLMAKYHDTLRYAFWDGTNPRYPTALPDSILPSFETAVRTLAKAGRSLRDLLVKSADDTFLADLDAIADGDGLTVQVHRFEPTFALPWSSVYDWHLPRSSIDQLPVCTGDCAHNRNSVDAVCVRGFWGYRHTIEELLVAARTRPTSQSPSIAASFDERDAAATTLLDALRTATGHDIEPLRGTAADLVDTLWKTNPRTDLVIIVGHVDTPAGVNDDLDDAPRLHLGRPNEFLTPFVLIDAKEARRNIAPPGPIVMLLGCGTADGDLTRLIDHVSTFLEAGTECVVGTTSPVSSDFVCHFAGFVSGALLDPNRRTTLGAATRDWRRALLRHGNPLAFSIIPYGDADVSLR